ncbi:MAG: hypothetical protein GY719_06690, partial [bacterium]|nr:hypothetical protein [bacterium]
MGAGRLAASPAADTVRRMAKRRASPPRPAPGELRMLQDLVETRVGATGTDQLATPTQVAAWLAGHALIPTDLELTAEDRARFAAFRDALRALVAAGRRPDAKLVERFNRAA